MKDGAYTYQIIYICEENVYNTQKLTITMWLLYATCNKPKTCQGLPLNTDNQNEVRNWLPWVSNHSSGLYFTQTWISQIHVSLLSVNPQVPNLTTWKAILERNMEGISCSHCVKMMSILGEIKISYTRNRTLYFVDSIYAWITLLPPLPHLGQDQGTHFPVPSTPPPTQDRIQLWHGQFASCGHPRGHSK